MVHYSHCTEAIHFLKNWFSIQFPFLIYLLSFYFLVKSRIFPNNINAGRVVGRMKRVEEMRVSV